MGNIKGVLEGDGSITPVKDDITECVAETGVPEMPRTARGDIGVRVAKSSRHGEM